MVLKAKESAGLEELAVAQVLSQLRDSSDRDSSEERVQSDSDEKSRDDHSSNSSLSDPAIITRKPSINNIVNDDSNENSHNDYRYSEETQQPQQQQWRSMLLTATSLVLTKETRRKFRKLLSVLRLASEHLNGKVHALKETMVLEASQDNVTPKLSTVAIRNDIILTIKKCLTVLSTLATSSLPESASEKVRNHILRLPVQWANQLSDSTKTPGVNGGKSESAVLALASETLVSIRKITVVLSETLDRADSWVEKLPSFIGKRMRDNDEESTESLEKVEEVFRSESESGVPPMKALKTQPN